MGTARLAIGARPPFRLDLTVWALRRRSHNTIDAWDGTIYTRTLVADGVPVQVSVRHNRAGNPECTRLDVEVRRHWEIPSEAGGAEVRCTIKRMLGIHVDLDGLVQADDERAVAALVSRPGIGRWSAEYVLLRGLGRLGVLPGDDVGARNNLRRRFELPASAGYDEVAAVAKGWWPYDGMVYFHLLLDGLARGGQLQPGAPELAALGSVPASAWSPARRPPAGAGLGARDVA